MKDNFDRAVSFSLSWEQWKSDLPADPGHFTIWGISSRFFPDDVAAMRDMSQEDSMTYATSFYKKMFWDPLKGDNLASGLDIVAFDTAINLGADDADAFLKQTSDWRDFLMLRIQKHCDRGKRMPQFVRGWINRCIVLYKIVRPL